MTYQEWASRHPVAAAELVAVLADVSMPVRPDAFGKTEQWAQQQVRFRAAERGIWAMRNNVGATPAKLELHCPRCQFDFTQKQQPVRYGLANDSAQLNDKVKSSDLILAIPRVITPAMVGTTFCQFGAVEVKHPGWHWGERLADEVAQLAFGVKIAQMGGVFTFSTGELTL